MDMQLLILIQGADLQHFFRSLFRVRDHIMLYHTSHSVCNFHACDNSVGTDTFGHKMLAGCGKYLENLVRNRLGVKARSVELNVSQRCSASMMSATDQQEAIKAGEFGVQAALNGETGKMISFIRKETSDGAYIMECGLEDVNAICNEEKTVPSEWITEDGSDVTEAFINYARPLIQGTVQIPCGEDGLPAFGESLQGRITFRKQYHRKVQENAEGRL